MKHRYVALAIISLLSVLGRSASGQTAERQSFETKMYSVEAISHFGVSDEKFAALTEMQKRSLLEARENLMNMLQAIERKRDMTKYVTPEVVGKYKTSTALAASVIDSETSILAAAVSDFTLVGTGEIRLKFFAIVSAEGSVVVSEKTAVLKGTDSGWRFAGME